ncbi:MAG: ABC transporter substrate-binding protein [Actinomycetia bacterium]|nr:ABC transporter substrate-binding protein [Actinomycetes bacterium]
MRRHTVLTALTGLSLALAGCSGPGVAPGPGGSAPAGANPDATLVVGITTDPNNLNPWKATQFQSVHVLETMYSSLTAFDKDLKVVPALAESWTTSADGKTVTLKLRSGVTFADGSAFDSADVKFSLDKVKDKATAAVAAASLASVTQVTAKDPSTVELALSAPDAALPSNLASLNLAILPSEATEETFTSKPNGTGAFSYVSRTPNQSLTVQRNPKYWGEPAKAAKVEFRVIPEEAAIVSAVQSGNVHIAGLKDPLIAKNAAAAKVEVLRTPQLSYHVLQLNATRGALTDLNVRLAIQCGIDRQQVLDTAALGEGEVTGPNTSPLFKSDPQARPCPTRDVARAKEYLAQAGRPQVTIKTIVSTGEYATSVNEAQNLKAQLGEVGITLELETLESGAYVTKWVAADFEAAVALNGGRPDPDGAYSRYFTSQGNLNKVAGYSSPTLDNLFAQGRTTTDEQARKEIYRSVDAELENNAVWVWLFTGYGYTVTGKGVTGFVPNPTGSFRSLSTTAVS